MKKFLTIIVLAMLLLPMAFADGMIVGPRGPIQEKGQVAIINFEKDGDEYLQKMIVAVQHEGFTDGKAAWIFPVPSNPDDVVIDVVERIPRFWGQDVVNMAEREIGRVVEFAQMMLLGPLALFNGLGRVYSMAGDMQKESAYIDVGQGVIIYEEITKNGVTVQTLGADEGSSLWIFLRRAGLDVPMKEISVFDHYIDDDFTFVVAFLEDQPVSPVVEKDYRKPSRYYGNQVGVEVYFHTDKPFFPMIPTSVYGSAKVPATIYVLDYVKPELYKSVENFVDVEYHKAYGRYDYQGLEGFFGNKKGDINPKYTVIRVNDVPSKYLEDDFYFVEGAPENVKYADSVTDWLLNNKGFAGWGLLVILSVLSGGIVGFLIFRDDWWKLVIVSLFNVFSIVGLIIALVVVRTKKVDKKLLAKIKQAGLTTVGKDTKRKFLFLAGYIVCFLILAWIFKAVFLFPL